MIAAGTLAETLEEYQELGSLGSAEIPTIVLNKSYAAFKAYIASRAKDLTDKGTDDASDRYAVGLGLGLLVLHEESEKRTQAKQASDPEMELVAKQAVARSVLLMMPAFDTLMKEAGLAAE